MNTINSAVRGTTQERFIPELIEGIDNLTKVITVTNKLASFRDDVMPEEKPGFQKAKKGKIYTPEQPPSVNQAREAAQKAKLSEDAYNGSGAPAGYTRLETYRDVESGMAAVLYRDDYTQKITIAYRGSEMGDADWITNEQIGTNQVPKQAKRALEYVKSVQTRYPNAEIDLTGHSLGGTLATMAGLYTGLETTNFDALGINRKMLKEVRQAIKADGGDRKDWKIHAKDIDNYHMKGEFVGDSDGDMDAGTYGMNNRLYGDVFYLTDEHWNPDILGLNIDSLSRPVSLHSMPAIIDELQLLSNSSLRIDPTDLTSVGTNAFGNYDDKFLNDNGFDDDKDLDQLIDYTVNYYDQSKQSWQEDKDGLSNPFL